MFITWHGWQVFEVASASFCFINCWDWKDASLIISSSTKSRFQTCLNVYSWYWDMSFFGCILYGLSASLNRRPISQESFAKELREARKREEQYQELLILGSIKVCYDEPLQIIQDQMHDTAHIAVSSVLQMASNTIRLETLHKLGLCRFLCQEIGKSHRSYCAILWSEGSQSNVKDLQDTSLRKPEESIWPMKKGPQVV